MREHRWSRARVIARPRQVAQHVDFNYERARNVEAASARAIRQCGVKREFNTAGILNPCEQAEHLHSLFARNKEWDARHGFTIHVGSIGKCGIRLTVYGDVEAARQTFGGDPLIARIITNDEGFPPPC